MHTRLFFVVLLSLLFMFGCDNVADGPTGAISSGPGSISGSYNPDGVAAIISGQVLLQAADDGAHGETRVSVRGYSSTTTIDAEGWFRLELILSEEDIARSDEDAEVPLTAEVVFTHPGYRLVRASITSIFGSDSRLCRFSGLMTYKF